MNASTISRLHGLSEKMLAAGFKKDEFDIAHRARNGTEITPCIAQLELVGRIPNLLAAGLGVTVSEWAFGYCIDIEPSGGLQFVVMHYRKPDEGETEYSRQIDAAVAALKQQQAMPEMVMA